MTPRTRRLAPFATVLVVGLLAACGGDTDSASTESSSAEPSTVTVTSTATPESADEPQQQELTKKQIHDALPEQSDAPKGFEKDSRIAPGGTSTRETDPEKCLAVYLDTEEIREWKDKHFVASDGVRYTQPGDAAGRASVSTFVTTYDRPVPRAFFDDAGKTVSDCGDFEEKATADSQWTAKKASNIGSPALGDQSYSLRVGLTELDLTLDQLWVRSGHNIINIRVLAGRADFSDETLSGMAEAVLEDLED